MSESSVTVTVNGREILAPQGQLLIDACEDADVYIPRFCHHPRMQPVGMCRMCLVEVDTGRGPALQPSCMLSVSDGMVVDTESDVTKKAQDGVLELLLINHPLDCPVCDKGGECPLQDQTMAYGPGESRFVEEKRHYEKPIPINDNVYLDRERCILCDRCTRFASDVAGDPLIHFIDRGNQTQVNTFPDHPFASYFSGNVVQICPVGALTAAPYRFKARPWDLAEVDSTYPNPMGDRINVQSSRNQVLRFQGVDSDAVNWGWLADKERFSFQSLQSEDRLTEPAARSGSGNGNGGWATVSWTTALGRVADAVATAEPDAVAVVGGARLLNEDQYAWTKLAKGVIGTDHVDALLGSGLPAHAVLGLPRATIAEACAPGGVIILMAPDPKESLGTLYLRLRHAVVHDGARLIELTPAATGLSSLAAARLHARPGELGALARALVAGDATAEVAGVPADHINAAHALLENQAVTVVAGRASIAEGAQPTVEALGALRDLGGARFLPAPTRGNIMGALDMGMSPGLLPGRTGLDAGRAAFADAWGSVPAAPGLDATGILHAAAEGRIDVLFLLGVDPMADHHDPVLVARAIDRVPMVVAVDLFSTPSVDRATVVLPAAAFTERSGSTTNIEGRIAPVRRMVTPPGTARADWAIAAELADRLGADLGLTAPEEVWAELGPLSAVHAGVTAAAIDSEPDGVLLTATGRVSFVESDEPLPARPVDAYSFRLVATRRMFDRGTLVQAAPALASLGGRTRVHLNPTDFNRLGVHVDEPVRVTSSGGSLEIPVTAAEGIPRGVAVIDVNRAGADVRVLLDPDEAIIDVRIETT